MGEGKRYFWTAYTQMNATTSPTNIRKISTSTRRATRTSRLARLVRVPHRSQ